MDASRHSDWIPLIKGESYFIRGETAEAAGADYFSVAVEIEQTAIVGHHHAMKEI